VARVRAEQERLLDRLDKLDRAGLRMPVEDSYSASSPL